MSFASLRAKQAENSEAVASTIVPRGKPRFLISATLIGGLLFWLVMNVLFVIRRHASLGVSFLVGVEAVCLVLGMLLGLIIGLRVWRHFERLNKSGCPK
jgi:hypothetical protein